MVPRYTRPEMGRIWSEDYKFEMWLRVEIAVAEAWAELGRIPQAALAEIRRARFDVERIAEIEHETQHDVIAFLRSLAESIGEESRYIHLGLTSSDVIDTALSLQLIASTDLLLQDIDRLRTTLRRLALQYRDTVMMGRTHGIHAEPTTFGYKMLVWYDEMGRHYQRLEAVRQDVAVAKLSGAVGTHANIPPAVEELAAKRLGLRPAAAETQIIQRDRHAAYLLALALLGSSLDKMATEIRHLQRTEVREVEEPFGEKQQGSSAMPHKRNPIFSERISGLARVLRGFAVPALENVVLWHERDISNSSVERVMLPDASILMDYMLALFTDVMERLRVYPERMRRNVERSHGLVFSQRVLLALIESGLSRDEAYHLVQRNALRAWDEEISFEDALRADQEVMACISPERLSALFDYSHFTRNIDVAYQRLGLQATEPVAAS
jgi:adenylosuccinate lyase